MIRKVGILGVGLVVLGVVAWHLIDRFVGDLCDNTVIEEVPSPSGVSKAILFERNCGATTGFSSQVSILRRDARLENKAGNVLIADGYPIGYALQWLDDSQLEISGVKGKVFKQEHEFSGVAVRYK